MKYTLIGGITLKSNTGTTTYTGLKVIGSSYTENGIKDLWNKNYEACGGLLLVLDAEGRETYPEIIYDAIKHKAAYQIES